MAQYDPTILQQFANILYRKARIIIIAWTALSLLIGLVMSALIAREVAVEVGAPDQSFTVGASVVIIIGYAIGGARAFFYKKTQTQLALCQKQIEVNTRQVAMAGARHALRE